MPLSRQPMHEVIANLHAHTTYSDGWTDHATVALDALRAGLDVVAVTDHNVWVEGFDGYRYQDERRVLLVTGEEIHDPVRQPQKNHLLVYEARRERAPRAAEPGRLLEAVAQSGGLAFLAHPVDPGAPRRPDTDLSWTEWDLEGYDGLEIWNTMTEFKSLLRSRAWAAVYAFLPGWIARGPFPGALERWDRLHGGPEPDRHRRRGRTRTARPPRPLAADGPAQRVSLPLRQYARSAR
jgi:hypothetical protein